MFRRREIDGIDFDLGNVLMPTEPNKKKVANYWSRFSKLDEHELLNILYNGALTQDRSDSRVIKFWQWVGVFDNGDISSYDMYCKMKDLLQMDCGYHDFERGWELIVEPDKDFINFLYELQHLRLGIISNLCPIHVRYIKKWNICLSICSIHAYILAQRDVPSHLQQFFYWE